MEQNCIRIGELAKRMSISRSAAYDLAHSRGFYPAFRIGRTMLVNVASLEKWLEEQTCAQSTSKAV